MPLRATAVAVSLLIALSLSAQEQPKTEAASPCAAATICSAVSKNFDAFAAFYRSHYRADLRASWLDRHRAEAEAAIAPICAQVSECFAVPGNRAQFCNDSHIPEFRSTCDRWTNADDREQCSYFVEAFTLGMDQTSLPLWRTAQECARANGAAVRKTKAPLTTIKPAKIAPGYDGDIQVISLDPDTQVPVEGKITIGDQIIYTKSNPSGWLATYYAFKGPIKLTRVRRADGHDDLVAPRMTITYELYPSVEMPMPIEIPTLTVRPSTDLTKLKAGRHTLTISAVDAVTGKPVEMRVMAGARPVGESNKPFELAIERGSKRPEIWLTSLFDMYSDVVVAPAAR